MLLILFMLFIIRLTASFSALRVLIIPKHDEERGSAFLTLLFIFPPGLWLLISLINNYKIDVFFGGIGKILLRDIIFVISFLVLKWIFNKIKELIEYIARRISKYDEYGYGKKDGFNRFGRNREGINKYTGTKYDEEGYNIWGWNRYKINKYTGTKYSLSGHDYEGFNKEGWFTLSYNVPEYPNYSYGTNKYTKTLFDEKGYDIKGYDKNGFDKYGKHKDTNDDYDRNGRDKDGFNKRGWNIKGINKYTGTKYDKDGYNILGEDRKGFGRNGFNDDGVDRRGFPHTMSYYGSWRYEGGNNIYTNTKYDKKGFDYYGNPKETKKITKNSITKSVNEKVKDSNESKSKIKEKIESLKICSIASGSNGNCYYIGTDNEAILIDDGISYRQLSSRMKEANLDVNSIKGIFISHEHSDHIYGLPIFYKNHPDVPIYFNENAYNSVKYKYDPGAYKRGVVNLEEKMVKLGGFKIYPFKKRHDASYPLSFRVEYNGISVGIFTDIGESSTKFQKHFSECNAVFLESNHDVTMLKNGPYDTYLRQRVFETHFSNDDAYNMLKNYANPNLQIVILVHISEKNNTIEKVSEKFKKLKNKYEIEIASRHDVGKVHEITN